VSWGTPDFSALWVDYADDDLVVMHLDSAAMTGEMNYPTVLEKAFMEVGSETAVLGVHWIRHRNNSAFKFLTTKPDTYFSRSSSEDVLGPICKRYLIPTLSFRAAMLPYMYANNPLKFFMPENLHDYPDNYNYMDPNDNAQALIASAVIQFLSNMRAPQQPPAVGCRNQKHPAQEHQPGSPAFTQPLHALGTDVWFTDVDDPLTVVYENYRNRKLNRLPPVHSEALTTQGAWISARSMWSLASPEDRKGWALTEKETTASGRLRPPTITTSKLGATFSFNADITETELTVLATIADTNIVLEHPRNWKALLRAATLKVEWLCTSGDGGWRIVTDLYRSGNKTSLFRIAVPFGINTGGTTWTKPVEHKYEPDPKIKRQRNCRFTFTHFEGNGPRIGIAQVRL
jgi:hypothetical protein